MKEDLKLKKKEKHYISNYAFTLLIQIMNLPNFKAVFGSFLCASYCTGVP